MSQPIIIQTACPSAEEAHRLSKLLLDRRLVAAAQIRAVHSMYWWQEEQHFQPEWVINFITQEDSFPAIQKIIFTEHSYHLPKVISLPISETYPEYQQWIEQYSSEG